MEATTNIDETTNMGDTTERQFFHMCFDLRPSYSEKYIDFRITIEVYILPVIIGFGILGNLTSLAVLSKDNVMKRTTAFLLQVLAVSDTMYLLACLIFQTIKTVSTLTGWSDWLMCNYRYVDGYILAIASIMQTFSVWLVLVVTADRYIAICKPLHAPVYSTMSRMRKAVLVTFILAILYNIPRFFEKELITYTYEYPGKTWYQFWVSPSEFGKHANYILVYENCLYFIFRFALPIGVLIFFNVRLAQSIKASYKTRAEMTNQKQVDTTRATLTLVVIVTVFIICATPNYILQLLFLLETYYPNSTNIDIGKVRYMVVIGNTFMAINSSCNFIIYCLLGKRFRRILLQMIGCGRFVAMETTTSQNSGKTSQSTIQTVTARV